MKLFRDDAAGCCGWQFFFWFFQVGRRAAAAPGLRRQGSAIEGHVWESYQDTHRSLMFQQLFWF